MQKKHKFNNRYKELVLSIIKKHVPNAQFFLFSSRARTTHSPCSDIDIALSCDKPISLTVLNAVKQDLEESSIPFFKDCR